jgi:hypothetical protein
MRGFFVVLLWAIFVRLSFSISSPPGYKSSPRFVCKRGFFATYRMTNKTRLRAFRLSGAALQKMNMFQQKRENLIVFINTDITENESSKYPC